MLFRSHAEIRACHLSVIGRVEFVLLRVHHRSESVRETSDETGLLEKKEVSLVLLLGIRRQTFSLRITRQHALAREASGVPVSSDIYHTDDLYFLSDSSECYTRTSTVFKCLHPSKGRPI